MRISIIITASIFIIISLMYFLNPFGTSSYDPRARIFGFKPYTISSQAMAPTLQNGDYIVVSTSAYATSIPDINDVIVFNYPHNRDVDYVMRVVAREGEEFSLNNGTVTVNGKIIDQPYLDTNNSVRTSKDNRSWTVPDGSLFVLGDNRDNSNDSRYWGFVPINDVVGEVSMIWMSDNHERIGKDVE